jgi:hypothetical protein
MLEDLQRVDPSAPNQSHPALLKDPNLESECTLLPFLLDDGKAMPNEHLITLR